MMNHEADGGFHTLSAAGITVTVDLAVGHLRRFEVTRDGRTVAPLHTAPWIDDPAILSDISITPNVRRLSGDFFCAPFGLCDIEPAPIHGWPANSAWALVDETEHPQGGRTAWFELQRPVMGARVRKELMLRDGHPFLYQRHVFVGGAGGVTAAHHAMTRLSGGGCSRFSAKLYADVPPSALETDPARGRSILRYPSRTIDLCALPLADGRTANLHSYPFAARHEDFFMLVEARDNPLGWTAVTRADTGDAVLVLKDPRNLPVTLVWMSNGGREYAPWNGRHTHVLGIEDARCWSLFGHAASVAENPLSAAGVPTAFTLDADRSVSVRQVLGALPLPPGWRSIAAVEAASGFLRIAEDDGAALSLPFDETFLFQE